MEQRSNYAAKKDAKIRLRKEECVLSMGQRWNDAAKKDVRTMLGQEEYAGGMEQRSMQLMNLLHSDQSSIRLLLPDPNSISMLLDLRSLDKEDGFPGRCPSSAKKSLRFNICATFLPDHVISSWFVHVLFLIYSPLHSKVGRWRQHLSKAINQCKYKKEWTRWSNKSIMQKYFE